MTPLDPRQIAVLRLRYALGGLILAAIVLIAELALDEFNPLPVGVAAGIGALFILLGIWRLPLRRYHAWGYRMEEDELVVRRGLLVRKGTVVPFARVQHIDLAQGPVERGYGVATLILNTAGTHASAVRLPGLAKADAEGMRDRIRSKIRQDLL